MNKKQVLLLILFIIIFMVIALYGIMDEAKNIEWNGFSYYLFVVPSFSIIFGLISGVISKEYKFIHIIKTSFLSSSICLYILIFLGSIHYDYPRGKYYLTESLGLLLINFIVLFILHGIISLVGRTKS